MSKKQSAAKAPAAPRISAAEAMRISAEDAAAMDALVAGIEARAAVINAARAWKNAQPDTKLAKAVELEAALSLLIALENGR